MNAIAWSLLILTFCCQPLSPAESTVGHPDLSVLKHYEGRWDCRFSIEPISDGDQRTSFTGVVEGKWVVGDKFMEQTGRYQLDQGSPPLVIKTLMSFDEKQSRYQYDYFNSSGEIHRSIGHWDAKTKTMTSTRTDENENETTIIA